MKRCSRTSRFQAGIALLLAGFACPSLSCREPSHFGPETTTVRLVIQRKLSNLPLLIADAKGSFARRGIRIERVPLGQGSEALPLLVRDEVDAAAMTTAINFLSAVQRGAELRVVASKGTYEAGHCSQTALVGRRGWSPPENADELRESLRGSRIGVTNSLGVTRFLTKSLETVGLDVEDVELQIIPNAGKIDALRKGRVDLARLGEPLLSRLVAEGYVVWKTPEDVLTGEDFSYIVFSRHLALEDRDLGRRFLEGYLEGIEAYLEGKTEENLELASRETGLEVEALRASCWPAVRRNAEIDPETLQRVGAWAVQRGYLDDAPAPVSYVDSTLLDAAVAVRAAERHSAGEAPRAQAPIR